MKSTLSTAAALMIISRAHALDHMEQLLTSLKSFDLAQAAEHAQNVEWSKYITTRHDSRAILQADKRRIKPHTREQHHNVVEAHHRIMDRRDRLGMPRATMSHIKGGPIVGQNYANLASFSGWILNLVGGLQYN